MKADQCMQKDIPGRQLLLTNSKLNKQQRNKRDEHQGGYAARIREAQKHKESSCNGGYISLLLNESHVANI
jgi:hypothetical protein